MSLLQYPRIYFAGEVSWDPGVTNNHPAFYDAENVSVVLPQGTTLAQYKHDLPTIAAENGSWNHSGTHAAVFENVKVTGASLGFNQPVVTQDPLVGKPLKLSGKLVDLDAVTVTGSQIFFDDLTLGDTSAGLRAKRSWRLHARHINFGRNRGNLEIAGNAGVVWNTVLRKQGFSQLFGTDVSTIMSALSTAMQDPNALGIFIRFHTYRTLYFQNGTRNTNPQQPANLTQLRDLYAQGENFSNPAYSAMVGVIGVWRADEAQSALSGRYLPAGNSGLGPAFIEVDETARRLVIDLGQTIPERDVDLEKVDLGALSVKLNAQSIDATLGSIPFNRYSRASYELTAGLIEIDLAALPANTLAGLSSGNLSLTSQNGGAQATLTESLLSALADDRDIYLDETETRTVTIQVLLRGQHAPAGTLIRVFEFDRSSANVVDRGYVSADPNGVAQFQVPAAQAGFRIFVFIPYAAGTSAPSAPASFDANLQAYVNVRNLPHDDALAQVTPDSSLTWNWVYENILAAYDVINSVMSRTNNPPINKPLDNQQQMELFADSIKQATAKTRFESSRYMPITRDMSAGKRTLLHRWCDLIMSGNAPQSAIPHFFLANLGIQHKRDFRMAEPLRRNQPE